MLDSHDVRLGEILRITHGYAFPGSEFSDDTRYPTLVTPGNFATSGGFREAKTKTFTGDVPPGFELVPDDLVITMTDLSREGDTLGLPALIPPGRRYLHNQRIGRVQIIAENFVNKFFLAYYLRTNRYRSYILGTSTGSTVRHTSPSRIESFVAHLPPLPEQIAIAEVLGALDDKIAANTKLADSSLQLAQTLFRAEVSSGVNVMLADSCDLLSRGIAPKYSNDDESIIVLNQKCVRDQRVSLEPARRTDVSKVRPQKELIANDVLVNSTGQGTLGRVARWTYATRVTVDSHITIVRFDPDLVDPVCGGFAMLNSEMEITAMAEGSTGQTELSRRELGKLKLNLPVPEKQGKLGERLANMSAMENSYLSENQELALLRDTLLPQLMSGKLNVKQAEKIVASAL